MEVAYTIFYYRDRAMRHRLPDTDQIGDAAFDKYPAPTGNEVAEAVHSENRALDKVGREGAWHKAKRPASAGQF